ncbi:MAG: hypothetical protein M1819_000174 [Sarea resinae]|nr:MAG: hypothetical protein M1819_000174 [Sarea resinae]
MTAQILSSELTNLIQDSKRKNSDLRHAAEKSLNELKALPSTSEAQLAAGSLSFLPYAFLCSDHAKDLSRRPSFIAPFLIACKTRNAKFSGIAVSCLQRLVVSRGLPKDNLKDVLEAWRESTSLGLDVQLKILQSLPPLLQNYADALTGELLGSALHVCSTLQGSKTAVVSSTAAATLQQLSVSVFDKVAAEDRKADEISYVSEIETDEGVVQLRPAALDAYRVFSDLCLLTEGRKPRFLSSTGLPQNFGLELIESILSNHPDIFLSHAEQASVLRGRVMPFIIRAISERQSFSTTVRVARVLYILLRRHLSILVSECEVALSLLTHMLDPEAAAPWKRALCMEIFRGLHSEPGLTRKYYAQFDEKEGKKNIVGDHLGALVRLSAEKPGVIGLGYQSSVPVGQSLVKDSSGDQVAMEAGGVAGIISGPVAMSEVNVPGISAQWSSVRVPCIDQLDKSDPPNLPESYIYSLTLLCVNAFSEGLAKFILPLTIPTDGKGKKKNRNVPAIEQEGSSPITSEPTSSEPQTRELSRRHSHRKSHVPINPLSLDNHPLFKEIKTCSEIVSTCWPAVLATCSTFLHAALDTDYYHSLVRSFQKFTQVAGLLRLSTPRDAFLTTLGKAAVPAFLLTSNFSSAPSTPTTEIKGIFANAKGLLSVDSIVSQSSTVSSEKDRQPSADSTSPSLNTRNLLCLRALLNLAIALGPTLGKAWSIVLETLQQADFVIYSASRKVGRQGSYLGRKNDAGDGGEVSSLFVNFGSEISAVETAADRMFESTADFPNESFVDVLTALCGIFGDVEEQQPKPDSVDTPVPAKLRPQVPSSSHRRAVSISGLPANTSSQIQEHHFALAKIGELASINLSRLTTRKTAESGWDVLIRELVSAASSSQVGPSVRLRAAEVLHSIIIAAATTTTSEPLDSRNRIQRMVLSALREEIIALFDGGREETVAAHASDTDVHLLALEALKSILEQCGESLVAGWDLVFEIIASVFGITIPGSAPEDQAKDVIPRPRSARGDRSPKLIRSSFSCLQLICSDFLSSLPRTCELVLLDALYRFCSQEDDLNVSLTTLTFFWEVSDFLQSRNTSFDEQALKAQNESNLLERAESDDKRVSGAALWVLLLLRLAAVTTDDRAEVRNGAIQTLLRIFDAYGDDLTPGAWDSCLRVVIFKVMEANDSQKHPSDSSTTSSLDRHTKSWNETTIIMLNGISGLLENYLDAIVRQENFTDSWQRFLHYLSVFLERPSLQVRTTVFKLLRNVLSKVENADKIGRSSAELVWDIWCKEIPVSKGGAREPKTNNQDAFLAYVQLFQELYRLIEKDLTVQRVEQILDNLRESVCCSDSPQYATDIDHLTPVQTEITEAVKMIRTDIKGAAPRIIRLLAGFVALAFDRNPPEVGNREHTFIALSKISMDLLQGLLIEHVHDADVYAGDALLTSLQSLVLPIARKYRWRVETKEPFSWKKATSVTVAVLEVALPVMTEKVRAEEEINKHWKIVVEIIGSILAADTSLASSLTSIAADETFDIQSFTRLSNLITPALGSPSIADSVRRAYGSSLFTTSLIHSPTPPELPQFGTSEPLKNLYKPRLGRTYDPPPSLRSRMSYVCLDTLFALVSLHDGSPPRVKLAQAAAPFLILRAAITIRAYIADQPLRGRMPTPSSQRKELLYILEKLIDLEAEPRAIPDAPGVSSDNRKHMHRLYPLVVRAAGVAWRDRVVLGKFRGLLGVVGEEFGIE